MTQQTRLRLMGVPEHFNEPWKLALADGAFAAAGVDLIWQDAPGGTGAMIDAMRSGETDITTLLTEGAVADYARHGRTKLLGTWIQTPLEWGIHVRPAWADRHVSELEGGRVAISRLTSGSHLMAMLLAKEAGWDPAALEFVHVGTLDGARASFADGASDVFLWERLMTHPLVVAGEFACAGTFSGPWPAMSFVAESTLTAGEAEAFGRALAVVRGYCERLQAERRWSVPLLAARHGLTEPDVATWLDATTWGATRSVDVTALDAARDALATAGALSAAEAARFDARAFSDIPE